MSGNTNEEDGSWNVVVDKKLKSQRERQEKKLHKANIERAQKIADEKGAILPPDFQNRVKGVDATMLPAFVESMLQGKKDAPKKKKPKSSSSSSGKPKRPKIETDDDMALQMSKILRSTPGGWLLVSGVGVKLQDVTGHSWNKRFKADFGQLRDFIVSRKKDFYVDPEDRVWTRAEWRQKETAQQTARAHAKKEAAGVRQAAVRSAAARGGRGGSSCCSKAFFALIVVVAVALAALVAMEGHTLPQLLSHLESTGYVRKEWIAVAEAWFALGKEHARQGVAAATTAAAATAQQASAAAAEGSALAAGLWAKMMEVDWAKHTEAATTALFQAQARVADACGAVQARVADACGAQPACRAVAAQLSLARLIY